MKRSRDLRVVLGVLSLMAMLFPAAGLASSQEPPALTLEECIKEALSANLKLVQARMEKRARGLEARAYFKDLLPKLSTRYSYTGRRDADTVTIFGRTVNLSSHDAYDWSLVLTQPVFQGGALWNRYRAARIDYDMSEEQLRQVTNDMVRRVKRAYYSVLQAAEIEKERAAAVRRLEAHLEDARGFYEVGLITKNDLLQSEVELAQARQDLVSAAHRNELAKARLNLLLRRDLERPVRLDGKLEEPPPLSDFAGLREKAMRSRPEIQAGTLAIKKAQRELEIAKASFLPRVDLTATYEKRGITPDVSDNPYGDNDMASVVMSATWELWAWGQTRARVAAAASRLAAARAALNEVKDSVALEVKEALLRFREARRNVSVARSALEQAEENFRLNTQRYREQVATSTDVLDAQALLTKARTNYYNALAQEIMAKADLDYATGTGE